MLSTTQFREPTTWPCRAGGSFSAAASSILEATRKKISNRKVMSIIGVMSISSSSPRFFRFSTSAIG